MSRPPVALLSMAALALGGQLSGMGSPTQIRKKEDWGYPDDLFLETHGVKKSGVARQPKSVAVLKRRAKNKAAALSRKRGRA